MLLCLALFCLLVAFDNLSDYTTNYLFVQHVLSMDTTFPGSELRWRAITNPTLWQLAYAAIILGEALTGALYLLGAFKLWQAREASGAAFNQAKSFAVAASLLAFLVWYFGFMVVAGEWFAMWESSTWNGQEPAFRFYMTVLAVLIFVALPDGDLDAAPPRRKAPRRKRKTSLHPRLDSIDHLQKAWAAPSPSVMTMPMTMPPPGTTLFKSSSTCRAVGHNSQNVFLVSPIPAVATVAAALVCSSCLAMSLLRLAGSSIVFCAMLPSATRKCWLYAYNHNVHK
jgi:predicted small integral membrane protein